MIQYLELGLGFERGIDGTYRYIVYPEAELGEIIFDTQALADYAEMDVVAVVLFCMTKDEHDNDEHDREELYRCQKVMQRKANMK